MTVYAESSAILALLLGEDTAGVVRSILSDADFVVSSGLTLVECDRTFHRAYDLGQLSQKQLASKREALEKVRSSWTILELDQAVLTTARGVIPGGPLRSLDALHLASAIHSRMRIPETMILTLDRRLRQCATALGFTILPPAS